jgi:hypothetical protein
MEKPSRPSSSKCPFGSNKVGTTYHNNRMAGKKKSTKTNKPGGGDPFKGLPPPEAASAVQFAEAVSALKGTALLEIIIDELQALEHVDTDEAYKHYMQLAQPFVTEFIRSGLEMSKATFAEKTTLVRNRITGQEFTLMATAENFKEQIDEYAMGIRVEKAQEIANRLASKLSGVLLSDVSGKDAVYLLVFESTHYQAVTADIRETGILKKKSEILGKPCMACRARLELEPETVEDDTGETSVKE